MLIQRYFLIRLFSKIKDFQVEKRTCVLRETFSSFSQIKLRVPIFKFKQLIKLFLDCTFLQWTCFLLSFSLFNAWMLGNKVSFCAAFFLLVIFFLAAWCIKLLFFSFKPVQWKGIPANLRNVENVPDITGRLLNFVGEFVPCRHLAHKLGDNVMLVDCAKGSAKHFAGIHGSERNSSPKFIVK